MTAQAARTPMVRVAVALAALALAGCQTTGQPVDEAISSVEPLGLESALRLGEAAAAGGDLGSAVRIFQNSVAANPQSPAPRRALADAYFRAGAYPEAGEAYRGLASIQADSVDARVGLGRVALSAGDAAEAERHFRAALAIEPDNLTAMNGAAVSLDLRGQHAAAQALYDAILARDPVNRAVMSNRALSVALGGDAATGARTLDELARAPVRVPQAVHNLALALALDGKKREAGAILAAELPPQQARENMAFYQRLRR